MSKKHIFIEFLKKTNSQVDPLYPLRQNETEQNNTCLTNFTMLDMKCVKA